MLICDLAETYNIYDYKSMPPSKVAIFCIGLRDDSRLMMELRGDKASFERLMLANIRDYLAWIQWSKTEKGQQNKDMPEMITSKFFNGEEEKEVVGFKSSEEFEQRRKEILGIN